MNKKRENRETVRTESIALKLSRRELEDLDAIVSKTGLSRSAWVRMVIYERIQSQKAMDWFGDD